MSASSQPTPQRQEASTQSDYEVAAKLGFEEFTLGNYIEARARFTEAHKLSPNARTLRALGMVEYELKRYVEATAYLQQALSSRERPLTSEQRKQTEQLLRQAFGYVTRFRFALKPDSASLTIDGVALAQGASRAVLLAADARAPQVSQGPGSVKGSGLRCVVMLPPLGQPRVIGGAPPRASLLSIPLRDERGCPAVLPHKPRDVDGRA